MRNEEKNSVGAAGIGIDPLKFHRGGLIEHVHVEAAGESASVTYYFKENDAQDSSDKYNNAECTGREWGLYDLTPLIAKSVGGVLIEDVASVTLSFKVEGDISQWKSGSGKDMKPCIEVCLNDYSWAGGQQLKNIEVTKDTVEVTLDNIDPFAKSIGFSAYAFKPSEAVKFTVTVTASTKRESAAYTKALDIITNSVGVSGNKFENSFNQVVAISSEDEEWALYQKAAKVDNARFVLKYTINTTGDQTGGWANFFEGRMRLSNPYDEIHMEIPNWKPDADKFICVLDGVKQPNDKLLADGEHIVYYKCRDYINAFNTHTCDTHSEGDISFDMSNAIAFQSGLDEGRTMTITDLYVEVPVGTDLSGDFDAYLYLDQQHGNTKQLPTHVTLYDTEYDIECTGAIGTYSIIKGGNSGEITSIPNGSIIRVSNFEVDGVKQPFKDNAEYVDFIVGTDERGNPDKEGRVAAALYFNDYGFEVFNMDDSLNREGSKTHVTFKILKPASEPEPVPKPVAPEGYEIVYELDMTSANITPGHQGVNGDNAAIAEALQKDGAYVEFITCYPGANSGWIQIDFENGEYIQYNNYNTEIRTEMAGTDRTSIVRLPNAAVLDAIKQAEEKSTTIKGISLAAANYEPETEADTARENKCLGLFIYAKIPGDEPEPEPGAPECVFEGPEVKTESNQVFAIPDGKNIPVGETVTVILSYNAEARFRIMLGNGTGNSFDRSDAKYLEAGRYEDVAVELTARDNTDDIKYIHFRPESSGISTLEVDYDSIFIFYGTAAEYEAWKAKPENADFTTVRERLEHPKWETEGDIIEITEANCGNAAVTVEDGAFVTHANVQNAGQALIKLPKTVAAGQKISIHVVGTQPEGTVFRIWPSNAGRGEDIKEGIEPIVSETFSADLTYTVNASGVDSLSIKGGSGQNVMEGVTITHIAVKYYDLECDPAEQYPSLTTDNIVTGKGDERITSDGSSITVTNTGDTAGKLTDVGIGIEKIVVKCGDTYRVHIRGTASDNFRIRVSTDGYNDEIVDNWDTVTVGEDGSFDGFFDLVIGGADKVSKLNGAEIIPVQIHIKGKDYNTPIPDTLTITHLGVVYPEAHEHNYEYTEDPGADTHTGVCSDCYATVTEPHNWGAGVPNTDEGHIDFTCSDCGATKQEELEHVHTGDGELKSDEDSHWYECTDPKCPDGGIYDKADHQYKDGKCEICQYEHENHTLKADSYKNVSATEHSYECAVCHKIITESHVETLVIKGDASGHYDYCEKCGYTGETQPHDEGSYTANNDGKTHTVDCKTCGYKNESEEHVAASDKYEDDDVERYHVCKYCGGRMDETKHDYEWVADEDGIHHHEECKTCHHKKTGSTEEHDYKNGKCSKCDYNHPEDEHVWGSWTPDFGGTTHTRTCSICGKEDTDPHNLPEEWTPSSEDETKHLKKCPDCGYEVTGEHNFGDSYEYVDAETHMQTCADCKKTVTSSHNYEEGKYSNSTTDHWQVCTDCKGESDRENHKYVDGSDRCSVCNYWNHQHTMKWMDDDKNHWEECTNPDCDYKTEKEPHVLDGVYDYNSTQHSQTCSVCHAKVSEAHTLVDECDDDFHWQKCEVCDYETRPVRHTLKTDSDENGHWEYCENCEYKSDPVAHTPEKELGHDADSHWSICSVCGEVYGKTAHTPSDELKHDSEGHWTVCSACGYENTEKKEAHTWDTGKVTVEPTETTEGEKTYTCTECGETKTESVPKSSHTHVAGKEWKHDEKTHWHECVSETCNDKTAKLDEAEHVWDDGKITVEPTYTKEGEKTYTCTECGETKTESVPKSSHTHVAGEEWKHDEKTHWHECVSETCDDKTAKLDEAEHVWDDGKVTVEPTYTKEGEKLYTCEVCGETKTETVPVKGHEHSTVTKSDEKGHWKECTICGETVGEVEAHTPGEWITDSEATSTEAGKRHKECTVCGYVTDVLEVPATGDIDVEVPTVGNVPKVELPAEQQEVLKNAVIDEEDVEAIESGASIDIELTVENAESTIAPEDKAVSDEAAVQGNYTHVRYLDINLTKVVTDASGASTSEEISELGKEVKIVITVPLALAKPNGRDFAVIRVHDGEAAVLKDLDSDPNTVTISTNLFSSYTLVYVDTTPVPSTPGGLIGHVHVITGLQNDAHYHWRGCFICSMRVDYEPHRFIDSVCTVCHYRDPDYVPEVEEEEPAEEAPDTEVTVVDAPTEGTEQGGDSEGTPEVTDTPANLPETEAEVVEVKEDDETSENPKTGVVFTGIGAVMVAIAALVAKRK